MAQQPKKSPPAKAPAPKKAASGGSPLLADVLRVLGTSVYSFLMALALAFIPVSLLLRAGMPSPVPVENNNPTPAADQQAAVPSLTPNPGCLEGALWWSANQSTYNAFAASLSELFSGAYDVQSVLVDLRSQRDNFANGVFPQCVGAARAELIAGMDETIAAFGENNPDSAETRLMTGKDRFAAGINLLWQLDIVTDPLSAPALDVAQGGGADCGASDWYEATASLRGQFILAFGSTDIASMTREQFERFIDEQRGLRDQVADAAYPDCAAGARQHFLNLMDAMISTYNNALVGAIDATFGDFERISYEIQFFTNWKRWLGLPGGAADY
ncbi:MAG: hypothetical protein HXY40_08160 [Chloroflexi bacterium]|nr:hypothetical protein [Chloroflexota bacterium]